MIRLNDPVSAVKNLIDPPKPKTITREVVKTPAQETVDEGKAAEEARRKAAAEAAKRQGRARTLLSGGGNVATLQTGQRTLLGS